MKKFASTTLLSIGLLSANVFASGSDNPIPTFFEQLINLICGS